MSSREEKEVIWKKNNGNHAFRTADKKDKQKIMKAIYEAYGII